MHLRHVFLPNSEFSCGDVRCMFIGTTPRMPIPLKTFPDANKIQQCDLECMEMEMDVGVTPAPHEIYYTMSYDPALFEPSLRLLQQLLIHILCQNLHLHELL